MWLCLAQQYDPLPEEPSTEPRSAVTPWIAALCLCPVLSDALPSLAHHVWCGEVNALIQKQQYICSYPYSSELDRHTGSCILGPCFATDIPGQHGNSAGATAPSAGICAASQRCHRPDTVGYRQLLHLIGRLLCLLCRDLRDP